MKRSLFIAILLFFAIGDHYAFIVVQDVSSPDTSTHQFEEGFKGKYKGNKFNYEGKAIKTKDKEANGKNSRYSKDRPSNSDIEEAEKSNRSITLPAGPFQLIFWIVGIAALAFLVYALVTQGNGQLFGRSSNQKLNKGTAISAENIQTADINSLIAQAEKNGDFRLATRYLYLSVLKNLTLKKLIIFEDEKTNSDYLFELEGHKINALFRKTSYLYNYIWYGEFPVDTMQYAKVKDNFGNLLTQIA